MSDQNSAHPPYFPFAFPLSRQAWQQFAVASLVTGQRDEREADVGFRIRKLAETINDQRLPSLPRDEGPPAETLLALRTLNQALRHVASRYFLHENPGSLDRGRRSTADQVGQEAVATLFQSFVDLFPPTAVAVGELETARFLERKEPPVSGLDQATIELLLLFLNVANPATRPIRSVFDDQELRQRATYIPFITGLEEHLEIAEAPGSQGQSIFHLLREPMLASPDSLAGQIEHIRRHWAHLLPDHLVEQLQLALDRFSEVDAFRLPEFGPPPVLEFGPGSQGWDEFLPEPEAFSQDAAWMSNVVLMAKSVHVWLDQLSRWYGRPVHNLGDIPDEELDRLARWGVTGLWLIGLWERSEASRLIKQYMGNPDAAASAYALRDYHIAADLGGQHAYENLRDRAAARGIRLASDMVPNHMGIDSRWVIEHPHWFLQADHPPFPAYSFTGGDLSDNPGVSIRIEDGYWNRSDAAVVFQRLDNASGQACYIYHGNDGTSMPWNDTAQLNFLMPEVREAVIQVILSVARMFPIIRFDAAMTLAKKHYQRLWFPAPGDAGAIPSRAEHGLSKPRFDEVFPVEFWREVVDRVASEVPDTLLLAEAFWLMEGYFVRTLGMHRVYNSAFMNMLKMEDNQKYRQTIKNVLEFSPPVLQRFVNFMNNPDEKTAVEQFGRGDKYFGCALLLVTMPGLPMLGHGQIEGFSEKYGMEYRRAMWDETIDHELVRRHEREIFPLMRRRSLFSGAHNFALYDFQHDAGYVDENVFAYSNRDGNERGLIIFNNSYESTSGRMHFSSAINVGSADQPHLEQRTLAQALDLAPQPGQWVAFRDHIDGLEYLRSSEELAREGLHTSLRGYQYRALIDFRILDDSQGQWARLAEHLAGGGVADLALAARSRELAPALEEFMTCASHEILSWLETLTMPESEADSDAADGSQDSREDPVAGGPVASCPVGKECPDPLREKLTALAGLVERELPAGTGPAAQKDWKELQQRLPGSRLLQAHYLALLLKRLPAGDRAVELAGCQVKAQDRSLFHQALVQHLQAWTGHEYAGWATATLASILADHPDALLELARGKTAWMLDLLKDPQVRNYLGVNLHQGRQWLRQEPLDSLLDALALGAWLAPDGSASLTSILDACSLISGFAANANYDLELFTQELTDY